MTVNYKEIGKRIKSIRTSKGWTQRKLAEKIDMTPTHVSHIENGTTKLGLPTIVDIANVLNTTVDRLLCDSVNNSGGELISELSEIISGCTIIEVKFIIKIIKPAIDAFRYAEYLKNNSTEEKK